MSKNFTKFLTTFCLLALATPQAQAAIQVSGDYSPRSASFWTNGGNTGQSGYIGYLSTSTEGFLTVDGGSNLELNRGYLGNLSGTRGTVTVTGAGSTWYNSTSLHVGYYGTGTLNIEDGGFVRARNSVYVTRLEGSQGNINFQNGTLHANTLLAERNELSGQGTIEVHGIRGGGYDQTWTFSNSGIATNVFTEGGDNLSITLIADGTSEYGGGSFGGGDLLVNQGASVTFGSVFLGLNGSDDTATVTGAGSVLEAGLSVGNTGTGTLHIENGGLVNSSSTTIGSYENGIGTATVTGAGSTLKNRFSLTIGSEGGDGTLNIKDGGLVDVKTHTYVDQYSDSTGKIDFENGTLKTRTLWADRAELRGQGRIEINGIVGDGYGDTWTFDGSPIISTVLDEGGDNLEVILTADGTGTFGANQLIVRQGTVVEFEQGYLGSAPDSTSVATVTGAGSTWNNTSALIVGDYGTGTLNIEDGGTVNSSYGLLGYHNGSQGTATVKGQGSSWNVSGRLTVGDSGIGTLNIEDGGLVKVDEGTFVSNPSGYEDDPAGSEGSIAFNNGTLQTVTLWAEREELSGQGMIQTNGIVGTGYQTTWDFNGSHVASEILDGGGDRLAVTVTADGTGNYGAEDLLVRQGAVAKFDVTYLAYEAGSSSTATITDAGSTLDSTRRLFVGYAGDGSLRIENGGSATTEETTIGSNAGGTGTITVTGTGSSLTHSRSLYVGSSGTGILNIENGATVSNTGAYLATSSDGNGTVNVRDAGSSWNSTYRLTVGSNGTGTLNIENGGLVTSNGGRIGDRTGSQGEATVTGAGSHWNITSDLIVGRDGTGTLRIENGGRVSSVSATVADDNRGMVTVTGPGSTWTNTSHLDIGYSDDGTLSIENGGTVSSSSATLGRVSFNDGTVNVKGIGSTLNIASDFTVGNSGNGRLNIEDGGLVKNSSATISKFRNGYSKVMVTGASSRWETTHDLTVGGEGRAFLTVADVGHVTAGGNVSVNSSSKINLHLGASATESTVLLSAGGNFDVDGTVYLYADGGLAAGTYQPISASSYSDAASNYLAVGGVWNHASRTFEVSAVDQDIAADGSVTNADLSNQRVEFAENLLIMSFDAGATDVSLTALAQSIDMIGDEYALISYFFDVTDPDAELGEIIQLSYYVGEDYAYGDFSFFREDTQGSGWLVYTPENYSYANGWVNFSVTGFSGYSVTVSEVVPEPTTGALLLAGLGIAAFRRRRS